MKIVNSSQMRQLDRIAVKDFAIPSLILMEHGGMCVFDEVIKSLEKIENKKVVVICGPGNNGGDGFVVARLLFGQSVSVKVFILGDPNRMGGDAKTNYDMITRLSVDLSILKDEMALEPFVEAIKGCGLIVDALFGTGLNREVDDYIKKVIARINDSEKPVISVDIPSGISGDDGSVCGTAVRAKKTVTLQLLKIGNIIHPGAEYVGELICRDIGIPQSAIEHIDIKTNFITEKMVKSILPQRIRNSHKGDYGKVYVVAGSTGMTGAAALTCEAVLRSGAGLLKIAVPQSLNAIMEGKLTEAITVSLPEFKRGFVGISDIEKIIRTMEQTDVIAIGPGCGQNRDLEELLRNVFEQVSKPIVLDADALNALSNRKELLKLLKFPVVITPHVGEMSRLTELDIDYIQKNRISVAVDFAKMWNIIVILKGHRTVIASPNGEVYINGTGNPGMATPGSGDVLTGIVTGFIAQGIEPIKAAVAAVYIHGLAGDRAADRIGEYGLIAGDIIGELPYAVKEIVGK